MSLGSHLILITCSFGSNPFIHFTCQYHTQPVILNSCIMPNIPHAPLYTYRPSYNHTTQLMHHAKHTSCSIIYLSPIIQSYSTKIDHSGNIKHPIHSTVSPSTSLRLRGLTQARRARSGEPPSRLGESTKASVRASRDLA